MTFVGRVTRVQFRPPEGGPWADLTHCFATVRDVELAETARIIREYLAAAGWSGDGVNQVRQ